MKTLLEFLVNNHIEVKNVERDEEIRDDVVKRVYKAFLSERYPWNTYIPHIKYSWQTPHNCVYMNKHVGFCNSMNATDDSYIEIPTDKEIALVFKLLISEGYKMFTYTIDGGVDCYVCSKSYKPNINLKNISGLREIKEYK